MSSKKKHTILTGDCRLERATNDGRFRRVLSDAERDAALSDVCKVALLTDKQPEGRALKRIARRSIQAARRVHLQDLKRR